MKQPSPVEKTEEAVGRIIRDAGKHRSKTQKPVHLNGQPPGYQDSSHRAPAATKASSPAAQATSWLPPSACPAAEMGADVVGGLKVVEGPVGRTKVVPFDSGNGDPEITEEV